MAYINPQKSDCVNCNKSGLAIMPVRYAVVPESFDSVLPAPMGNKVSDVKLAQHKYALRTLRAGFIYLFHEKHARGSQITREVYSVSEAGTVWKRPSPGAMKPVTKELACSSTGHSTPAPVITLTYGRRWQQDQAIGDVLARVKGGGLAFSRALEMLP